MFEQLVKERYSCRKFASRKIEEEKLQKVLEVASLAPTAKNNQPQRIYVLESEEALKKVDALSPCRYGAPVVLLFAYEESEEWQSPFQKGIHSGVEDVSIIATHAMLEATELGLATCWVNYFANAKAEEAFGLPASERAVLLLPIGYPEAGDKPSPRHMEKKKLEVTVRRK